MMIDRIDLTSPAWADLSATTDILGNPIQVGDTVFSFDFTTLGSDGGVWGMNVDQASGEMVSYIQGVVEAIGEDVKEGCPRYRIRVTGEVHTDGKGHVEPGVGIGTLVYPPVNGIVSLLTRKTFGVVRAPRVLH